MSSHDLVIVGAGPAGSCAGREAAKAGLKVLVIDKEDFPRDKVCGGGLRPEILEDPHMSFLAARRSEFIECQSMRTVMQGENVSDLVEYKAPSGKPIIYGTTRRRFDEVLVNSAREAGAEIMTGNLVKRIEVGKDMVRVGLASGRDVQAKVVIGAGGMQDPVAKYLRRKEGLPTSWPLEDIGVAVACELEVGEGFVQDAYGSEMTTHLYLKPQGVYGYAWAFPRRSTVNLGFGGFFHDMRKMDIRALFKEHISHLKLSGLLPERTGEIRFKGARIPLRGPIDRTYSDRMMLVGDAGGFVSPLSGDGISFALTTGRLAAETACRCVGSGDCGKKALSGYERAWRRMWGNDFKALCQIADQIRSELDRLIRFAKRDKRFVETMVWVYNGHVRPSKAIRGLKMRYLKNLVLDGGRPSKKRKGKR
jgi:geranylgeranyl reductase family protein